MESSRTFYYGDPLECLNMRFEIVHISYKESDTIPYKPSSLINIPDTITCFFYLFITARYQTSVKQVSEKGVWDWLREILAARQIKSLFSMIANLEKQTTVHFILNFISVSILINIHVIDITLPCPTFLVIDCPMFVATPVSIVRCHTGIHCSFPHRYPLFVATPVSIVRCHTGIHCSFPHRYQLFVATPVSIVRCHTGIHCSFSHRYPLFVATPVSIVRCNTGIHCSLPHRYPLFLATPISNIRCHTGIQYSLPHRYPLFFATPVSIVPCNTDFQYSLPHRYPLFVATPVSIVRSHTGSFINRWNQYCSSNYWEVQKFWS